MAIKSRAQNAIQLDTIQLRAKFNGSDGLPTDLDAFPTITIIQPDGRVYVGPTSVGVYRLSTGVYGYDLVVPYTAYPGVWDDVWDGSLDGFSVSGTFNFVVEPTDVPAINTDGYLHLGDDTGFNYNQVEIANINKVIKALRARLNSSGLARLSDAYGNVVYESCDIYTVDQLAIFAATSMTAFNQVPYFTFFTYNDTDFVDQFFEVLVQHATIYALASKALIERGREFNITDNGLGFQPPGVSDLLNTQWNAELQNWWDKVKMIKNSMRPAMMGLGTLRVSGSNPAVMRLRHLRQRQFF